MLRRGGDDEVARRLEIGSFGGCNYTRDCMTWRVTQISNEPCQSKHRLLGQTILVG